MTDALLHGFLLGLGLIVAIGAQNAFVLRQGLKGQYVFAICLTCALSDAVLISTGVGGFAAATMAAPWLAPVLRYGGILFLVVYGARSLWAALEENGRLDPAGEAGGLAAALGACLAFTWLNPHVYLDTLVFLGSISSQYPGHRAGFALGAIAASFLFFFSLGFGARLLRPLLARPNAWRAVEVIVALTMWSVAASLWVNG